MDGDNALSDARLARAAEHWSNARAPDRPVNWWMHPTIVRHVNRVVCGEPVDGQSEGFHRLLKARMPAGGFRRAVSVGSGVAAKEIALLEQNIVQGFDLFEISEERLRASKRLARRHGVFERIRFHRANAFETRFTEGFDLVYWNSSLHHMFDAAQAVRWSHRHLVAGGYFAMDDFVGQARFQWTDAELRIAARVRGLLPDRLMVDPADPSRMLDRELGRPDLAELIAVDPSEAADSENILPAVREVFPDAEIILSGGLIYGLALGGVMANFDDETDAALLQSLLLLDEHLAGCGQTHLAVALARKQRQTPRQSIGRLLDSVRRGMSARSG